MEPKNESSTTQIELSNLLDKLNHGKGKIVDYRGDNPFTDKFINSYDYSPSERREDLSIFDQPFYQKEAGKEGNQVLGIGGVSNFSLRLNIEPDMEHMGYSVNSLKITIDGEEMDILAQIRKLNPDAVVKMSFLGGPRYHPEGNYIHVNGLRNLRELFDFYHESRHAIVYKNPQILDLETPDLEAAKSVYAAINGTPSGDTITTEGLYAVLKQETDAQDFAYKSVDLLMNKLKDEKGEKAFDKRDQLAIDYEYVEYARRYASWISDYLSKNQKASSSRT